MWDMGQPTVKRAPCERRCCENGDLVRVLNTACCEVSFKDMLCEGHSDLFFDYQNPSQ